MLGGKQFSVHGHLVILIDAFDRSIMRKPAVATSILIVLILAGMTMQPASSSAQSRRYTLTIRNNSSREIHRLHMSWMRDKDWGPNLLPVILRPAGPPPTLGDRVPA